MHVGAAGAVKAVKYVVEVEGERFDVEVGPDDVRVNGRPVSVQLAEEETPGLGARSEVLAHLLLDGRPFTIAARRENARGVWNLELGGRRLTVSALDARRWALRAQKAVATRIAGPFELVAPMPGLIVDVEVALGDAIRKGQGVVIMEAMKMENELRSEVDGVVAAVRVQPGQTVERGELLAVIHPASGEPREPEHG